MCWGAAIPQEFCKPLRVNMEAFGLRIRGLLFDFLVPPVAEFQARLYS